MTPRQSRSRIGSNISVASIPNGTLLFSYETPVAAQIEGRCYRTNKRWSSTTTHHINNWLPGAAGEPKPQEWFDAWADGSNPDEQPVDPFVDAEAFVGGIVILLQTPDNKHGTAKLLPDDGEFLRALSNEVEYFKGVDDQVQYSMGQIHARVSITLINGIIPLVFEVPNEPTDLNEFCNRKAQECLMVYNRLAKVGLY